jgi:4-hydroxymandelate oxidase
MSRWKKLLRSSSNESLPTADVTQFEPLARRRLSQMAYDYVRSGGGDEISMRENRAGFERLQLEPRVLVDVSQIDTRVNLFGGEIESLILLAPVKTHQLYHRKGIKLWARAGRQRAGTGLVIALLLRHRSMRLPATRKANRFQLYVGVGISRKSTAGRWLRS